jgi:hypothetical protein
MSPIRIALMSAVIVTAAAGTAMAPRPSAAQSMSNSAKSTADDVSKWTQKQWKTAKAKWSKEKDKWASCNKRATRQKLSGRKSWSFLYTCMTS